MPANVNFRPIFNKYICALEHSIINCISGGWLVKKSQAFRKPENDDAAYRRPVDTQRVAILNDVRDLWFNWGNQINFLYTYRIFGLVVKEKVASESTPPFCVHCIKEK